MSDFKVGDKVTVSGGKWQGIWTVTKVNQVNMKLEQNGARLNAHPSFLTKADPNMPETQRATVSVGTLGHQVAGAFVKTTRAGKSFGKDTVFVVLADKGDRINVTKPGGDGGRYVRMPRSYLTPVPAEEVLK